MEDEGGVEYDEGDQFRDQRAWHGWWWRVMAVGEDGTATDPTHHPSLSFPFFFRRGPFRPPPRKGGQRVVGGGRAPRWRSGRRGEMQVEDVMRRPSGDCAPREQQFERGDRA